MLNEECLKTINKIGLNASEMAAKKAEEAAAAAEAIKKNDEIAAAIKAAKDAAEAATAAEYTLTHREVMCHVDAFAAATKDSDPELWPEEVKAVAVTLKDLDAIVSANPEAKTGDEDKELTGKENYISPFSIPMKRRRQTFMVSAFLFFTAVPFCCFLTVVLLLLPMTSPFMLCYLGWIFYDNMRTAASKKPLPRKQWWSEWSAWKHARDYFPMRLQVSPEVQKAVDPEKNYLFCYHPHGVHSFGAFMNFGCDANETSKIFPGIKFHLQTLSLNFKIPFWRETCVWGGAGDASASTLRKTLTAGPGESAVLVVGGAEESLKASPRTNDLTLSKRKGFVKIALQTGAALVPVYGFGENDVYGNLADGRPKVQKFMKKVQKTLGFALPLISGRGFFNYNWGVIPHRRLVVTVVGLPVVLPKIEKPNQEEIDHWHTVYVEALLELYQEHRQVYDLMAKSGARAI